MIIRKKLMARLIQGLLLSLFVLFLHMITSRDTQAAHTGLQPTLLVPPYTLAGQKEASVSLAALAPIINASKRDELLVDNDGDGNVDPGDTVEYTVVAGNSGDMDAEGVLFSDTIDVNTTLVAGTLASTPLARDDGPYSTVSNAELLVDAASGLLVNDVDPDGSGAVTLDSYETTSAGGGEVVVGADGSFSYIPAPDFSGVDSFTYTVVDGDGNSDGATVRVNVSPVVRFINDTATDGDGRFGSPFNSLVAFSALVLDETEKVLSPAPGVGGVAETAFPIAGAADAVTDTTTAGQSRPTAANASDNHIAKAAVVPALSGETVDLDLGMLNPSQLVTITFAVTVNDPFPVGIYEVCNQASLSAASLPNILSDDPDTPTVADPTCTSIEIEADLEVIKTDGQTTVVPGRPITYTIEVTNNGPAPVIGALVTDTFPLVLANVSWSCLASGDATCPASGSGDINVNVDLPVEGSVIFTAGGIISPAATGTFTNTAAVAAPTAVTDPVPGNNRSNDVNSLLPEVDIALTSTESVDPVTAGSGPSNLTYVITATNNGPSNATDVTIDAALTLPTGVAVDLVTPGIGTYINPTWTVPNLDVGNSETLTFTLSVGSDTAAGTNVIGSTATVTGADQMLINTGDDTASEATSVVREIDLLLTIDESTDPVMAGSGVDNLNYVVTITNTGPSFASGVVLTGSLTMPAGVTLNSVTPSGTTTWDEVTSTWNVGDLPAKASHTLTFVLTVGPAAMPGTDVVTLDTAVTAASEPESNTGNNTAFAATSIVTGADLVVAKLDSIDPATAGETLTYTVSVTNNGPSDAQNVLAGDTLPAGITFSHTNGCAQDPGGVPTCSLGTIVAGDTVSYTIAVVVAPTASGVLTNTVSVTSDTSEANSGDESDDESTVVSVEADLQLSKHDDPDPVIAGHPLTYTLTITNNGPSAAANVTVVDTFPQAFTYGGDNCGGSTQTPAAFVWSIGFMNVGTRRTCVITGVVNAGVSGTIINTAEVSDTTSIIDPNPSNNRVDEPTTVYNNLFSVSDVTLNEGDSGSTAFNFIISRTTNAIAASVDVSTANGTALASSDYVALQTTTINFAAGEPLTQTVTIEINGDTVFEDDETFFLNLSNPVNGTIAESQGVGSILNDDAAPSISINDVTVSEGIGTAVFTVMLDTVSGLDVSVNYASNDDTALAGSDYIGASGTLTITAGEITGTISILITDDTLYESAETFTVMLSNPVGVGIDDGIGIGTINDNDSPPQVSINDHTVTEGDGTANFTVMLNTISSVDAEVAYTTVDDTAVAGEDYTATTGRLIIPPGDITGTISIPIIEDALNELDETFIVRLTDPINATIGDNQGVGTITDNDPLPQLSIDDVTVDEGAGTAVFTLTLSAVSGLNVDADYETADSTAVAPDDYTARSNTITIPAGRTTSTISVPIVDDTLDELTEYFTVELSQVVNAVLVDGQGEGTIIDNDTAGLDFSSPIYTVNEAAGTADISVALAIPAVFTVTVDYTTNDDTAVAGDDYTAVAGTLVFAPGTTSRSFQVPILDDALDENDEALILSLSNPVSATLGTTNNPATLHILDDDGAPSVSFTDSEFTVRETVGSAVVTVTLSNLSSLDVTVDYFSSDGTAVAVSDYTPVSGTLTIPAGQTTVTFTIPIQDDNIYEPDEALTLSLINPANAVVGTIKQAVLTIIDDDPAALYLPLVAHTAPTYPDLVVNSLVVGQNNVQIVVTNQGNAAVVNSFWVDLYIDPQPIPTAVNQIWPMLASEGLVWGVTDVSTLVPGGSLVLTLDHPSFRPELSHFSGTFVTGTPIYVQVDSANTETTYGAVLETHETTGDAYNNITSIIAASIPSSNPEAASTYDGQLYDQTGLPPRNLLNQNAAMPGFAARVQRKSTFPF